MKYFIQRTKNYFKFVYLTFKGENYIGNKNAIDDPVNTQINKAEDINILINSWEKYLINLLPYNTGSWKDQLRRRNNIIFRFIHSLHKVKELVFELENKTKRQQDQIIELKKEISKLKRNKA